MFLSIHTNRYNNDDILWQSLDDNILKLSFNPNVKSQ